ncbi:hypothetical protein LCGC14_2567450, partial [marine sediment metagenome]
SDVVEQTELYMFEGGTPIVWLRIKSSYFQHRPMGFAFGSFGPTLTNNQWYHVKIDWWHDSGPNDDFVDIYVDEVLYIDYAYARGTQSSGVDRFRVKTFDTTSQIDAFGESWNMNYTIGDNLNTIPTKINFTSQIQIDTSIIYSNDTLEAVNLFYSFKTDISQLTNISIYNFDSNNFTLIQSVINLNFNSLNFTLNQFYYNFSYDIIILFELVNATNYFELYLDQFKVQYNWTKTSGDIFSTISKSITFDFLNRYDSNFDIYKKLYKS